MKQLIFIACLLIGYCTWGYSQTTAPPPHPPKKSMRISPVETSQGGNSLTISFNLSLGKVAVSIISPTGASVYQCTVDTTAGTQLPIDTTSWSNGSYPLRITSEDGEIVCELVYYKE